jgi:hypothetical protein
LQAPVRTLSGAPVRGGLPMLMERSPAVGGRVRRRVDVAALVFGVHDGDEGTWGIGAQVDYGLGSRVSVVARGEGSGERIRPLGPGQAVYRVLRFGVGIAVRRASGPVFLDADITPEAVRLALRGEGLPTTHDPTIWGWALDGRVRLGLRLAPIVPFIFGDAGYALTTARLRLDDRPASVTLSRWSLAAGAGLLFSFGPSGG